MEVGCSSTRVWNGFRDMNTFRELGWRSGGDGGGCGGDMITMPCPTTASHRKAGDCEYCGTGDVLMLVVACVGLGLPKNSCRCWCRRLMGRRQWSLRVDVTH